jgi:hypothetical protein
MTPLFMQTIFFLSDYGRQHNGQTGWPFVISVIKKFILGGYWARAEGRFVP